MKENIFLFDLDSTITKKEIIPFIAGCIGKEKELEYLTEKAMSGEMPFEENFRNRVMFFKDIPIDKIKKKVRKIPLNEGIVKFIKENKDRCFIATSNLDVWIHELIKEIGILDHCFSSKALIFEGKIKGIHSIVDKAEVVQNFKNPVIAIGDGANDISMIKNAAVGIAYGGVRKIAPILLEHAQKTAYSEEELLNILNDYK